RSAGRSASRRRTSTRCSASRGCTRACADCIRAERMAKHVSETPATQFLKRHRVAFGEHPYDYVEHGGTGESARQLGAAAHAAVKTLVMQDDAGKPLIVLMHGDRKVSTKNLARSEEHTS